MNIEDLIRAANPVQARDLDAAHSLRARRTLTRILADHPGQSGQRSLRRGRKVNLITAGLVAAAASALAVAAMLAAPGPARHPGRPLAPGAASSPRPHATAAAPATARQVLLAASANVPSAPLTGRYWHFKAMRGLTFPAGTPTHPYDISLAETLEEWDPSVAGQKAWGVSQQLGAVPATPADAAAWRAAGSLTIWRSGQPPPNMNYTRGAIFWARPLAASTTASPPFVVWGKSDGTVGTVEGDTTFYTAAQFRQVPASPRGVRAMLRRIYDQTGCDHETGCSPWTSSSGKCR